MGLVVKDLVKYNYWSTPFWAFRSPYFTSNTRTFNNLKEQYPYLNPILNEQ